MLTSESLEASGQKPTTTLLQIDLVPWLPKDSWYCSGVLFIRNDLPLKRISEIIAEAL